MCDKLFCNQIVNNNMNTNHLPLFADLEFDNVATNITNNAVAIDAGTQTTLFYNPTSKTFIENNPQFPTTCLKHNGFTKRGIEMLVEVPMPVKPNASTITWNDGKTIQIKYATNAEIAKLLKKYVNAIGTTIIVKTLQSSEALHFMPEPPITQHFSKNDNDFVKKFC